MANYSRGKLLVTLAIMDCSPQIDENTPVIFLDTPSEVLMTYEPNVEEPPNPIISSLEIIASYSSAEDEGIINTDETHTSPESDDNCSPSRDENLSSDSDDTNQVEQNRETGNSPENIGKGDEGPSNPIIPSLEIIASCPSAEDNGILNADETHTSPESDDNYSPSSSDEDLSSDSDDTSQVEQYRETGNSPENIEMGDEVEQHDTTTVMQLRTRSKRSKVTNNLKWVRQENINKRMKGKDYLSLKLNKASHKYETVAKGARKIGPPCNCKMAKKSEQIFCDEFVDADRTECFKHFWNSGWEEKKTFVSVMVDQIPVKRKTQDNGSSRRNTTIIFHLKRNNVRKRVCKKMFLQTLDIGEWSVLNWIKEKTLPHDDHPVEATTRRRKEKINRDLVPVQSITNFLNALSKMESHYCRAQSSKLYLEPVFQSVQEVYHQYILKCSEDQVKPLSHTYFRTEFSRLNLSLYRPKKDQCDTCTGYHAGNITIEEYKRHEARKDSARKSKTAEKELASEDSSRLVFTMDVESVLMAPRLTVSQYYYKMKLVVHNFTFFNLSSRQGDCYLWHEGAGNVTANEFTTIIIRQIESCLKPNIKTVVIFSDGCCYQNRSATLSNALAAFAFAKHIEIFQYYLEKGHTQMECDSMHAAIERRMKNRVLYTPACYVEVCRNARTQNPYNVHYLDFNYFKNYSALQNYTSIRPGNRVGDPKVTDIRCLAYRTNGTIDYKVNYEDDWNQIPNRRKSTIVQNEEVPQLYQAPVKIKPDKFSHLQDLKKNILKDYHTFYDTLSH